MGLNGRITDTRVANGSGIGILSSSETSMIRVTVTDNGDGGIFCAVILSSDCQVIDSVVTGNTSIGVALTFGVIEGSVVKGNGSPDILGASTLIRGNRAGSIDGTTGSLLIDNLYTP